MDTHSSLQAAHLPDRDFRDQVAALSVVRPLRAGVCPPVRAAFYVGTAAGVGLIPTNVATYLRYELVIAESGKAQSGWRAEKTGQSYFRKAGVEHDVRNETSREIVSVATEIKR